MIMKMDAFRKKLLDHEFLPGKSFVSFSNYFELL